MLKQVKVTANPKTGLVFTNHEGVSKKDGKQYGYVRVEELEPRIDFSSGVAKVTSPRSALKSFVAEDFAKVAGYMTPGRLLDGQIITIDSVEKLGNANQKTAGEGGDALTHNGQPLYQYTEFTSDLTKTDVKILSDRGVAANAAKQALKATVSVGLAD